MANGAEAADVEQLVTDYLGQRAPVAFRGDPALPVQGPPVAPGAPGGVGGAPGGGAPGGGSSLARVGGGGSNLLGIAKQALTAGEKTRKFLEGLRGTEGESTRGDTGGVSLADVIRSNVPAAAGSSNIADILATSKPDLYGGAIGAEGGAEGLRGLGSMTPGGQARVPADLALVNRLGGGPTAIDVLKTLGMHNVTPELAEQIMGALGGLTPADTTRFIAEAGTGGIPQLTSPGFEAPVGAGAGAPGAGGALSTGGLGAGAAAAILGAIASATGNPELAKAAQALSAAATGVSLGTTAANLAATGGTLAASGATAGIGAAGGAALAPIAAFMLIDALGALAGKKEGTFGLTAGMGDMMKATMGDFPTFTPELMQNVGQQAKAFGVLESALPYVRSKEELGELLNTYRNYLGTTTGIPLEDKGGIYALTNIPDVGGLTHGQPTPQINWAGRVQADQAIIDRLLEVLPGEQITDRERALGAYEPGERGEAARRLWQQFFPDSSRTATRASTVPGADPLVGLYQGPGQDYAYVTADDLAKAQAAGTIGQGMTWDPETAMRVFTAPGGIAPRPASEVFTPSQYWQQLTQSQLSRDELARIDGGGLRGGPEDFELLEREVREAAAGVP